MSVMSPSANKWRTFYQNRRSSCKSMHPNWKKSTKNWRVLAIPSPMICRRRCVLLTDFPESLSGDMEINWIKRPGRLIDVIRSNTKKMGFLINDLLFSFSRVQKINMIISIIDMDKLVNEVWDEIRAINQERKLRFKATKILPGYGDKALIRQVLYNLISNAVKFTVNQNLGIIEMSSYKNNTEVIYCLKDNGTGFDMSYYDKLFGVFQRLHGEQYEGTGIGLAIVQRVVNRHGGRVWAEGEVDKGATFYFTLSETPQNQTTS